MTDTTDPIGELAEVAALALAEVDPGVSLPHGVLRPIVEAVLDRAAAQQWIEKQLSETGLKNMDFRNGVTMELEPAREMVAAWCGAARAMLGDAPNYSETPIEFPDGDAEPGGKIEMGVKVAESPERYVFILQRVGPHTLTPHEARQKADRERDDALRVVAEWCTEAANTDAAIHTHDAAVGLALRMDSAGHTLPEVTYP